MYIAPRVQALGSAASRSVHKKTDPPAKAGGAYSSQRANRARCGCFCKPHDCRRPLSRHSLHWRPWPVSGHPARGCPGEGALQVKGFSAVVRHYRGRGAHVCTSASNAPCRGPPAPPPSGAPLAPWATGGRTPGARGRARTERASRAGASGCYCPRPRLRGPARAATRLTPGGCMVKNGVRGCGPTTRGQGPASPPHGGFEWPAHGYAVVPARAHGCPARCGRPRGPAPCESPRLSSCTRAEEDGRRGASGNGYT
eukprot:scaffold1621_cov350-Prasinococcus_capsulatus_cf.AAC.11